MLLGVYAEDELSPHQVGPDAARDVTPAKGLAAKLDAIAGRAEVDPEPEPDFPEVDVHADEGAATGEADDDFPANDLIRAAEKASA